MRSAYPANVSAGWRRLLPAIVFAAAVVFGMIGYPAVAGAEWDIEKYDNCVHKIGPMVDGVTREGLVAKCCNESGGVWQAAGAKCVAPPAKARAVV